MVSIIYICCTMPRADMLQYKTRYLEMYGDDPAQPQLRRTGKSARRKVGILIRELSDDDDDSNDDDNIMSGTSSVPDDSAPWRKDFNGYLYSKDQLGEMTITEWWGVRIFPMLSHCANAQLVQY